MYINQKYCHNQVSDRSDYSMLQDVGKRLILWELFKHFLCLNQLTLSGWGYFWLLVVQISQLILILAALDASWGIAFEIGGCRRCRGQRAFVLELQLWWSEVCSLDCVEMRSNSDPKSTRPYCTSSHANIPANYSHPLIVYFSSFSDKLTHAAPQLLSTCPRLPWHHSWWVKTQNE